LNGIKKREDMTMKKIWNSFGLISIMLLLCFGCGQLYLVSGSNHPGPPPHAKAYGYHKKHVYRYYRDLEIYWDSASNMYMAFEGNRWISRNSLPWIANVSYAYVIIETDAPNPWKYHASYKRKYPPQKHTKK